MRLKLLIGIAAVLAFMFGIISTLYYSNSIGEWTGIGKDSNKSVTTEQEINPKTQEVLKITKKETENFQSAKTLWDWLGLSGTIAIPFALFYFERTEQRRSDKRAQEEKEQAEKQAQSEKEIADRNLREQALEAYIDRMSELLIDKELKILINEKTDSRQQKLDTKLDTMLDIARFKTLSVLRRLDNDAQRKGSLIRFLFDAELIRHLDLSNADLSNADLNNTDLSNAKLNSANLSSASLEGANLSSASLEGADLNTANFTRANLEGADLQGANFTRANLEGADLQGANLEGASLNTANLVIANLSNANLERASLNTADLSSANLSNANLSNANLEGANLSNANLEGANLEGAKLSSAKLSSADLQGANLEDANLNSANLEDAKNLTSEQVKKAKNWDKGNYNKDFRVLLGFPSENAAATRSSPVINS
ncbi:pentapeptide repeat-containing protein (plasmid) [Nostoc sp. C057]|uniref:pentapeptide repeat-containing protein n=1 Tax=Nostoc sp. C057 TaxID=2576903 RepID=UPI0015C3D257|nr:pentapeptide repeat-containing protein [Nostoc sp. C057]QLE53084.1 pentapeptide repeat-containing protein [Nostoc sp. C057]